MTSEFKHDLLNRLGAAKMNAELALRNKDVPPGIQKNLERVVANLLQIQDMIIGAAKAEARPTEDHANRLTARLLPNARGKSVLVIDDSEDLRALFIAILKPRGYQITVARNQNEALAHATSATKFDLILLDYKLGDHTGSDVLDAFEKQTPEIFKRSQIVLFTGLGELAQETRVQAIEQKSLGVDDIVKLVEKYC